VNFERIRINAADSPVDSMSLTVNNRQLIANNRLYFVMQIKSISIDVANSN
jgi:hypothetical protein